MTAQALRGAGGADLHPSGAAIGVTVRARSGRVTPGAAQLGVSQVVEAEVRSSRAAPRLPWHPAERRPVVAGCARARRRERARAGLLHPRVTGGAGDEEPRVLALGEGRRGGPPEGDTP